jgi:hypothetical protein
MINDGEVERAELNNLLEAKEFDKFAQAGPSRVGVEATRD